MAGNFYQMLVGLQLLRLDLKLFVKRREHADQPVDVSLVLYRVGHVH